MNCKNCKYSLGGVKDSLSDICDGCTHDPDTGWGGFTDYSINRHFNSNSEYKNYYDTKKYDNDYDDFCDEFDIM